MSFSVSRSVEKLMSLALNWSAVRRGMSIVARPKHQSQLRRSDMKNDCANLMPLLTELGVYGDGFCYKHVALTALAR